MERLGSIAKVKRERSESASSRRITTLLRFLQNDEEFYPDTVVTGKNIRSAGLDRFPEIEQMFRDGRVSNVTKYFLLRTGEDGREGAQLARCGLNKDEAVKVKRTAITCKQLIEMQGKRMTVSEAAAVLGVNRGTVSRRWKRMGLKPLRDARSEKGSVQIGGLISGHERALVADDTPKAANTRMDGNRVLRSDHHSDRFIRKYINLLLRTGKYDEARVQLERYELDKDKRKPAMA
jgi:hypothetical protein